jgi:hypothetical protein
MNSNELRMVEVLKELKDKFGALNVRAEFEAEGTKMEELLRLKEISMAAGCGLTLKIGGCESIRDMLESRVIGVNYLVAPMVESAYALSKYLQAVKKVFVPEERSNIEILCDIETVAASEEFDEMLKIKEINELQGIVIERVDLCFSMGLHENSVNDEKVNVLVEKILAKAKAKGIKCTIGGGVSAQSLPFFKRLPKGSLDRYETRKITFLTNEALKNDPEKGILKALGFELLWIRNKLSFYNGVRNADHERLTVLEQNYFKSIGSLI